MIRRAIFTAPELASVGLSEGQALAAGFEVEVRRFGVGKTSFRRFRPTLSEAVKIAARDG